MRGATPASAAAAAAGRRRIGDVVD